MTETAGLVSRWGSHVEIPALQPVGAPVASVAGVSVSLSGWPVLSGVDLVAHAGELVALVGPNGAGKSTLLGVLSGDRPADRGIVEIAGAPIGSWLDGDLARRRAVLTQRSTVAFPFTVEQVVRMGRAPWARTSAADLDDEVVAAVMAEADVTHLASRPVPTLSGGEAARTAFARVLAQGAQLLLLDEPTAALDLHHQELTLSVVRARVAAGGGAVVVLHDLEAAAAHADRIVVVAGGRIVADGLPDEVLRPTLLEAVYAHPVEVLRHPHTGRPVVVPSRPPTVTR